MKRRTSDKIPGGYHFHKHGKICRHGWRLASAVRDRAGMAQGGGGETPGIPRAGILGPAGAELRRAGDEPVPRFGHGVVYRPARGPFLLGTYHPWQQNTFTGRLTQKMEREIFALAHILLSDSYV